MDNTKVLEYLNQSASQGYIEGLVSAKVKKVTLFSSFPITGAANISDPKYFALIENLECLMHFKKQDLS